jgi:hypothetical protein
MLHCIKRPLKEGDVAGQRAFPGSGQPPLLLRTIQVRSAWNSFVTMAGRELLNRC